MLDKRLPSSLLKSEYFFKWIKLNKLVYLNEHIDFVKFYEMFGKLCMSAETEKNHDHSVSQTQNIIDFF